MCVNMWLPGPGLPLPGIAMHYGYMNTATRLRGLRGYVTMGLHGIWLWGYAATWLWGYVAMGVRGYMAMGLRGYGGTRLLSYLGDASHTTITPT